MTAAFALIAAQLVPVDALAAGAGHGGRFHDRIWEMVLMKVGHPAAPRKKR